LALVELRRLLVENLLEIPDHRIGIERAAVMEFDVVAQRKQPLFLIGGIDLPVRGETQLGAKRRKRRDFNSTRHNCPPFGGDTAKLHNLAVTAHFLSIAGRKPKRTRTTRHANVRTAIERAATFNASDSALCANASSSRDTGSQMLAPGSGLCGPNVIKSCLPRGGYNPVGVRKAPTALARCSELTAS
jgi:hypothetical protein